MSECLKYLNREVLLLLDDSKKVSNKAFSDLYNKYQPLLFHFCLCKTDDRQEAEDLHQDTWINFINYVKKGIIPEKTLPYLVSIARNLYYRKYRINRTKKFRLINTERDILENMAVAFEDDEDKNEMLLMIDLVLKDMSEQTRETFVLYWHTGLTYREIAEITGESVSCIKMRCSRALDDIKRILNPAK